MENGLYFPNYDKLIRTLIVFIIINPLMTNVPII